MAVLPLNPNNLHEFGPQVPACTGTLDDEAEDILLDEDGNALCEETTAELQPFTLLLTVSALQSITLPLPETALLTLAPLTYNFVVDWGDGQSDTITAYNQAETTHEFTDAGSYVVTITGTMQGLRYEWDTDPETVTEIQAWGDPDFRDLSGAFDQCVNMTITATDTPNLALCPSLYSMFRGCHALVTGNLDAWDVSPVTRMDWMFNDCLFFDEDLNSWDVSNVTEMDNMFRSCEVFNGNITSWVTTSLTTTVAMFYQAYAFNQDIGGWDVSGCTSMSSMFNLATSFNQDLNLWDVSLCESLGDMFVGDASTGSAFNGNIASWVTSACTNFSNMFYRATSFNQDISGWNVSEGTAFQSMFRGNVLVTMTFNQDISGWNVSKGFNFGLMFRDCASFSTTNYDLLLNAWSLLTLLSGKDIEFDTQYTIATSQAARDILTNAPNSWTITDNGGI